MLKGQRSPNEISGMIVDAAIHIHTRLGPGLLESAYQKVLAHELRKRGLSVLTEVEIPLIWEGVRIETGYRADLIVDGLILVELKSVEKIAPVHAKQLLTYLRVANLHVGPLLNFGAALMKDGISRVVNNFSEN